LAGDEGRQPSNGLLLASDGNWYGTTGKGAEFRHGTIFRLSADGVFSVVYVFQRALYGRSDNPYSTLTQGPDGQLYGSTTTGSKHNGTLYKISLDGAYTELHRFKQDDPSDGSLPLGPPVAAPDGNLYGVTRDGGEHGLGTVYRLSPAGELTLIHSFSGYGVDGSEPVSLIVGTDGALYGSSLYGPGRDYGVVFRMTLDGQWSLLHQFPQNRKDGVFPVSLVAAGDGSLVGVAMGLVSGPKRDFQGLIFRVGQGGEFSIIHGFRDGGQGGEQPNPELAVGPDGSIYGCAFSGGSYKRGTAFKLNPDGNLKLLYAFGGPDRPAWQNPTGGLALAVDGRLYGALPGGGQLKGNRHGTLIRITPPQAGRGEARGRPLAVQTTE